MIEAALAALRRPPAHWRLPSISVWEFGACWAHQDDCDGSCQIADACHGADYHSCDQEAVSPLGLCERHRKEIVGCSP